MAKGKKKEPVWLMFLKGLGISLTVYLTGIALLAVLAVRGAVEEGTFPVTAALCLLSALCGGLLTVRRCPWGPLPGGLLSASLFALSLAAVGGLCWKSVTLSGRGGVLLGCAALGGIGAGLLGAGRRKPKRRGAL